MLHSLCPTLHFPGHNHLDGSLIPPLHQKLPYGRDAQLLLTRAPAARCRAQTWVALEVPQHFGHKHRHSRSLQAGASLSMVPSNPSTWRSGHQSCSPPISVTHPRQKRKTIASHHPVMLKLSLSVVVRSLLFQCRLRVLTRKALLLRAHILMASSGIR